MLVHDDTVWICSHRAGIRAYALAGGDLTELNYCNSALPTNRVTSLFPHESSGLLMGTHSAGLGRYIGDEWTPIADSLLDGSLAVADIDRDSTGTLWVTLSHGRIVHLDTGSAMVYDSTNAPFGPANGVQLVVDARGETWVSCSYVRMCSCGPACDALCLDQWLVHLSDTGWVVYDSLYAGAPPSYCPSIVAAPDSGVILGGPDTLYTMQGGGWSRTPLDWLEVQPGWETYNNVNAMAYGIGDTLWLGSRETGIAAYTAAGCTPVPWCGDTTHPEVQSIHPLRGGGLVVSGGAYVWLCRDGHGERIEFPRDSVPRSPRSLFSLGDALDVASEERALHLLEGEQWTRSPYDFATTAGYTPRCVAMVSPSLGWLGTGSGLIEYRDSVWTPDITGQNHSESFAALALDSSGYLWAVSNYGVYRYRDSNAEEMLVTVDPPPYYSPGGCDAVAVDRNNTVWISCSDGIYTYDQVTWRVFDTTNSPVPYVGPTGTAASAIAVDKDNVVWIAAATGLLAYDHGEWRVFDSLSTVLPARWAYDVAIDTAGSVWVSCSEGLGRLVDSTWHPVTTAPPELDLQHALLEVTADNTLWMAFWGDGLFGYAADDMHAGPRQPGRATHSPAPRVEVRVFGERLVASAPGHDIREAQLFDASGRLVLRLRRGTNGESALAATTSLGSGLYLWRVIIAGAAGQQQGRILLSR
ncbi:MAG: hypothetical protein GF331_08295 [Chitinivibrionales bacterium]|nr:hypothetical protein [Chitinivibrionales bacterium]